jgi:prepilin-type N-terminal cleavage/methylation domain-containing protein
MRSTHSRGFTLVEMAVVFVIIGLLIGGVLRGTELINSAKARNVIDQQSGIQTAVLAFASRYKATAGDLTAAQAGFIGSGVMFSGVVGSTGGDGLIALTQPGVISDESVLVFQNLSATGLLSCSTCLPTSTPVVAGNAIAGTANSPINANGGYLQYGTVTPASGTIGSPWWLDAAGGLARNVLLTGGGINDTILAQVDIKVDDGLPHTGTFRQSSGSGAAATASCVRSAGTAWQTSNTSNCAGAWLF